MSLWLCSQTEMDETTELTKGDFFFSVFFGSVFPVQMVLLMLVLCSIYVPSFSFHFLVLRFWRRRSFRPTGLGIRLPKFKSRFYNASTMLLDKLLHLYKSRVADLSREGGKRAVSLGCED